MTKYAISAIIAALICAYLWGLNPARVVIPEISIEQKVLDKDMGKPEESSQPLLDRIRKSMEGPILFWGIVEDEGGLPIPDAEVSWSIMPVSAFGLSSNPGSPGSSEGAIKTDTAGRFFIRGEGRSLNIRKIHKTGYGEAPEISKVFSYGASTDPHSADENNPQRFLLIKNSEKPSLNRDVNLSFDWDDRTLECEIGIAGIKETLVVVPWHNAEVPGRRGVDWRLRIKLKNGEVFLGRNDGPPLAPASGYTSEVVLQGGAGPRWMANVNATIYLRTASGTHGRLRFNGYLDSNANDFTTASLAIRWNATGGRFFK